MPDRDKTQPEKHCRNCGRPHRSAMDYCTRPGCKGAYMREDMRQRRGTTTWPCQICGKPCYSKLFTVCQRNLECKREYMQRWRATA